MIELWQLKQRQSLPLDIKIKLSNRRIKEWYDLNDGQVYISFSGGKDSTVLLNLVRNLYPEVPAVFVDTGLEYPEIKKFVKNFDNVIILKPEMRFDKVIEKYGYPVISKRVAKMISNIQNPTSKNEATRKLHLTGFKRDGTKTKTFKLPDKYIDLAYSGIKISAKCCDVMKKKPLRKYEKETGRKTYFGTMAEDSETRKSVYLKTGCNNITSGHSAPLSFWMEKDIWEYINLNNLNYSEIYDKGLTNTGCMFCMFGIIQENKKCELNRFQLMQKHHPNQYKYCMENLGAKKILQYLNIPYENEKFLF